MIIVIQVGPTCAFYAFANALVSNAKYSEANNTLLGSIEYSIT